MDRGLGVPDIFPSCGSVNPAPPSLHQVPLGTVPWLHRYYGALRTLRPPHPSVALGARFLAPHASFALLGEDVDAPAAWPGFNRRADAVFQEGGGLGGLSGSRAALASAPRSKTPVEQEEP